jgi:hypothetical protein
MFIHKLLGSNDQYTIQRDCIDKMDDIQKVQLVWYSIVFNPRCIYFVLYAKPRSGLYRLLSYTATKQLEFMAGGG